jgi:hypothetical protein
MERDAIGSLAMEAAAPAKIRRLRRRGRPGKVGRRTRGSPRFDLCAWSGSGLCQCWGSAARPGGVRLELGYGELSAGAAEGAARRGSSSAGRQELGAPGTAESAGDKAQWRRRARHDVDGVHTGKGRQWPFL